MLDNLLALLVEQRERRNWKLLDRLKAGFERSEEEFVAMCSKHRDTIEANLMAWQRRAQNCNLNRFQRLRYARVLSALEQATADFS